MSPSLCYGPEVGLKPLLQLPAPNTHMPLKEAVSFCRGAEVRKVLPYTDPDSMPWFWFLGMLVSSGFPRNKAPQTRWLMRRNLSSHGSGGSMSKIRVAAGLISSEAFLFASQTALPSSCVLMAASLCDQLCPDFPS